MTFSDSGETDAKGRKRYDRNAPKTMPPKYQKTTKDFEVFGFHSRQRRAYVNLCMRYGLPPKENFQDRWIVRELSRKVKIMSVVYGLAVAVTQNQCFIFVNI